MYGLQLQTVSVHVQCTRRFCDVDERTRKKQTVNDATNEWILYTMLCICSLHSMTAENFIKWQTKLNSFSLDVQTLWARFHAACVYGGNIRWERHIRLFSVTSKHYRIDKIGQRPVRHINKLLNLVLTHQQRSVGWPLWCHGRCQASKSSHQFSNRTRMCCTG